MLLYFQQGNLLRAVCMRSRSLARLTSGRAGQRWGRGCSSRSTEPAVRSAFTLFLRCLTPQPVETITIGEEEEEEEEEPEPEPVGTRRAAQP